MPRRTIEELVTLIGTPEMRTEELLVEYAAFLFWERDNPYLLDQATTALKQQRPHEYHIMEQNFEVSVRDLQLSDDILWTLVFHRFDLGPEEETSRNLRLVRQYRPALAERIRRMIEDTDAFFAQLGR